MNLPQLCCFVFNYMPFKHTHTPIHVEELNSGLNVINFASTTRFLFDELNSKGERRFLPSCHPFRVAGLYPMVDLSITTVDDLRKRGFTEDRPGMVSVYKVLQPNSHLVTELERMQRRPDIDIILVTARYARILNKFGLFGGKCRCPVEVDKPHSYISATVFAVDSVLSHEDWHSGEPLVKMFESVMKAAIRFAKELI